MPVRGRPGGLPTQPGPGAPRSASLGLHWLICKRSLFRAEAVGSRCEAEEARAAVGNACWGRSAPGRNHWGPGLLFEACRR